MHITPSHAFSSQITLTPMDSKIHIAIVAAPVFSHQVPIVEFAKRLIQLDQDFHVTCIIPTLGPVPTASKSMFESFPPRIDSIFLPPANIKDLQPGTILEVKLQLAISRSMPSIRDTLKKLSSRSRLVALIADPLAPESQEFARELDILSYVFFPSSAMMLLLCIQLSKLEHMLSSELRELPQPIRIPGCVALGSRDLPSSVQDRSGEAYKLFLQRAWRYRQADGVLVNSFLEMEAEAVSALQEEGSGKSLVYLVGPLTQTGSSNDKNGSNSNIISWLDNQEANSVLYVSFGSGGTLSQEQLNELALGLELSKKKFLWANFRAPNDEASATYLKVENLEIEDPLYFLPNGFLERTKEQGLVTTCWAPQIQVLGHKSVGAFLCHCGWNSILESIVGGVPVIAWPLFAEQRTNAVTVSEGLGMAVRPAVNENGTVEKEEIARVIQVLMESEEGKEIKKRMKELEEDAADALEKDGSSTKALSQLALKWKKMGRE